MIDHNSLFEAASQAGGLGDIFGSDFFKAFLIFLASFFGSKHGTANGNGSNSGH